jgi:error-prone DNA polymerase
VLRKDIHGDDLCRGSGLAGLSSNSQVRIAGYIIIRQRPATAKGFAFMTLEDEDGMINVVVNPLVYQKCRQVFRLEPLVVVEGMLQRQHDNLNIIADALIRLGDEWEKQTSSTGIARELP